MPSGHDWKREYERGRHTPVVATDLDPRLTFDSFVVGPANRLASAAARRAVDAPGTSYNPLFIYSGSGLGKSHILSGIAKEPPVPQAAHKALGDQALRHGDKERAQFQYELAVEADPRLGDDIYIKLGAIALENSQTSEAGVLWRRALEINPENHSLQAKLDQIGASAGT